MIELYECILMISISWSSFIYMEVAGFRMYYCKVHMSIKGFISYVSLIRYEWVFSWDLSVYAYVYIDLQKGLRYEGLVTFEPAFFETEENRNQGV